MSNWIFFICDTSLYVTPNQWLEQSCNCFRKYCRCTKKFSNAHSSQSNALEQWVERGIKIIVFDLGERAKKFRDSWGKIMLGDRVVEKLLSFVIMKRWSRGCQPTTRAALRAEEKVSPWSWEGPFLLAERERKTHAMETRHFLFFCSGSYLPLL